MTTFWLPNIAVLCDTLDDYRILLDARVDFNLQFTNPSRTAANSALTKTNLLVELCKRGDPIVVDIVKCLVNAQSTIDLSHYGVMYYAARNGYRALVDFFLDLTFVPASTLRTSNDAFSSCFPQR